MRKHQPENNGKEKKPREDILGFRFKPGNNSFRKWFRLASAFWFPASIAFNTLPFLRKYMVNKFLKKGEHSYGKIKSIRLRKFRTEFTIHGLQLNDLAAPVEQILKCSAETITVRFDRKALRKGILICNVNADNLAFRFIKNEKSQIKTKL